MFSYALKLFKDFSMHSRYSRLASTLPEGERSVVDQASILVHRGIPWKAISLALFLLVIGCLLIVYGIIGISSHKKSSSEKAYGLLVLGLLTFLPGFHESRIAYYTWRGFREYSFSHIPSM
mmetsp:Transcript_7718/g.10429  ORF Transcript_7718/g.10429 Transcript_7718/m.10429 type:complete len:121 (-) Transcript_7718:224-586(-)